MMHRDATRGITQLEQGNVTMHLAIVFEQQAGALQIKTTPCRQKQMSFMLYAARCYCVSSSVYVGRSHERTVANLPEIMTKSKKDFFLF